MEGNSQPWLLAGNTEPCKVPARESELLQCTAKPFSCSPCAREDRGRGAELLSARHSGDNVFCLRAHGGSHRAGHALDQTRLPLGPPRGSEVTQLCSAILRYCLPLLRV